PPHRGCLLCIDVGGTLLGGCWVGFVAIIALDGSVEAHLAPGRALRSAARVKVCRVFLGADSTMDGTSTLGGVMAEGQASGALGVRTKEQVTLCLKLPSKEREATSQDLFCSIFPNQSDDHC
ncbi:hypothetical protein L873DRAFT_1859333, partial [Choiromyces venosus 120613-1]